MKRVFQGTGSHFGEKAEGDKKKKSSFIAPLDRFFVGHILRRAIGGYGAYRALHLQRAALRGWGPGSFAFHNRQETQARLEILQGQSLNRADSIHFQLLAAVCAVNGKCGQGRLHYQSLHCFGTCYFASFRPQGQIASLAGGGHVPGRFVPDDIRCQRRFRPGRLAFAHRFDRIQFSYYQRGKIRRGDGSPGAQRHPVSDRVPSVTCDSVGI